jgi:hypothetical protein
MTSQTLEKYVMYLARGGAHVAAIIERKEVV